MSDNQTPTCECCGADVSPKEGEYVRELWAGRLDGYCYECAVNRCDAYPGDCPTDHREGDQ